MDAFQRVRPSDLTATKGINSFDDMEVLGTPRGPAVLVHVEFRGWPILRHSWTQIDTEQNLWVKLPSKNRRIPRFKTNQSKGWLKSAQTPREAIQQPPVLQAVALPRSNFYHKWGYTLTSGWEGQNNLCMVDIQLAIVWKRWWLGKSETIVFILVELFVVCLRLCKSSHSCLVRCKFTNLHIDSPAHVY